ncbi:MAG TPA: M20/M25/M40 family metallo-hydrolase [Chakrabartia sp.]|nr:M20/M25/M40 family metallo-hydrolase [Chakrabartia sp.]
MKFSLPLLSLSVLVTISSQSLSAQSLEWKQKGTQIFKDIVKIPSVSDRKSEIEKISSYLEKTFRDAGFTHVQRKAHDETYSLILRWPAARATGIKPILLLGHMDVVDALRSDWPRDPFTLHEEGGYYYGRGTSDMKNGIAAITTALLRLKAEGFQPKRDIIVLFTGDEETDGKGAERAATEWRDLVDAEYALNADGGGGAFAADGRLLGFGFQTSEKMYQSFTFTATNKGGHSSRPMPDNAIYELADALKGLAAHRFEPMMNETTRAYFTHRATQETGPLGDAMRRWLANPKDGAAADLIEADPSEVGQTRTRCVATRLSGGHADNALPQTARAIVNCRIFPGVEAKTVQAELQAAAGDRVKVEPHGPSVPSPASPLRADVLKAYTDAVRIRHKGAPIVPSMSAGATDGLYFRATGMPVYGVDGSWIVTPDDERAHGRDERIPVKSFEENLEHWTFMVKRLAG